MSNKTHFIVEASHLFRAGDKFRRQFYVTDVVAFLNRSYFENRETATIVLHGSNKEQQAQKYTAALTHQGVRVIRMRPIQSSALPGKHFYKPTWYCHQLMGKDIPTGAEVVLVGFHNLRYQTFLEKYSSNFQLSLAAFTTPSKTLGWMGIPKSFHPYLKKIIDLDQWVAEIKS